MAGTVFFPLVLFRRKENFYHFLMDSWFCWPAILAQLGQHVPVICMAKNMPKVFYLHNGEGTAVQLDKKTSGQSTYSCQRCCGNQAEAKGENRFCST